MTLRIGSLSLLLGLAVWTSAARAQDPAPVNPIVDPSVDNTATNPAEPVQSAPAPASSLAATPKLTPPAPKLREDASLDASYVGSSSAAVNGGSKAGNMSEELFKFGYSASMPVSDAVAVRFEAGYRRFDFGSLGTAAAIPQSLETADIGIGASYQLDPKWQLFAEVTPQLDAVDGWSDSTIFRLSGALGYVYVYRPNIIFTTGLAINPGGFSNFPVMPVGGVHWKITDKWTLDLGLPRTALDYALTDKLHLWTGGSFEGGSFKTGNSYGTAFGRPDLDERKFTYREIRLGVGADYALTQGISLGGEVGSAVYREFDFNEDNDKVKADPAVFAQLGLKFQF